MEDFNKASTQVMLGVNITQLGASEPLLPDLDAPPCPHRRPEEAIQGLLPASHVMEASAPASSSESKAGTSEPESESYAGRFMVSHQGGEA